MTHAVDSPSGLVRRRWCPGSRRLEQTLGVQRESQAAVSGTRTHWLVQYCLEEKRLPFEVVGETLESEAGAFVVDEARAERATVMVEYVLGRVEATGAAAYCEVEVDPGARVGRPDMQGTSDVVLVWSGGIEVIDYKDGFEPVEVRDNDQLLAYLSGAVAAFAAPPITHTVMHTTVVQPRLGEQGRDVVSSVEVSAETLIGWERGIAVALEEADKPDAPAVPGDKQCRWCAAAGACKARAAQALEGVTFPMVAPSEGLATQTEALVQLAEFSPELLSEAQLVRFLEGIPIAREVFKRVEEYAQELVRQGRTLDGYYLKKTYGNRSWTRDAKATESALRRKAGLRVADMYDKKLRSPTQILRNKSLTKEQRDWVEENLIERKETGAKLAHVSEQGESAMPKAPEGVFGPVDTPAFLQPPTGA